jgi:hypothetical protein
MKYIITEDQTNLYKIVRRLPDLKSLVTNLYSYLHPCDYESFEHYIVGVKEDLFEMTPYVDSFETIDKDIIWKSVLEFYHEDIAENYMYNCVDPD